MDCIFCKIVTGEIPNDFVWQDEEIVVFKDINPKAPTHLLVVPKEHIESIKDLKDKHKELLAKLIYIAKEIAEKQNLTGYKLIFNVGREGGQLVDHIHLHLLGAWGEEKDLEKFPV